MKNRCVFCGRELGMMQRKKLHCGNAAQTVCVECYEKYKPLSAVERAEAALKTGRAEDMSKLRDYLEPVRRAQAEREEAQKIENDRRRSDRNCLRCHAGMVDYGFLTFKLGEETYFFSDLNRLMSGSLTMNIMRCESCGKVEFFVPDPKELETL